jgi:hypothetical protein
MDGRERGSYLNDYVYLLKNFSNRSSHGSELGRAYGFPPIPADSALTKVFGKATRHRETVDFGAIGVRPVCSGSEYSGIGGHGTYLPFKSTFAPLSLSAG